MPHHLGHHADPFSMVGTLLSTSFLNGAPLHVVAQRLGHASPTVTLTTYAHVMPGNQRDAANLFARLVAGPEHDQNGFKCQPQCHGGERAELRRPHLHGCGVRGASAPKCQYLVSGEFALGGLR